MIRIDYYLAEQIVKIVKRSLRLEEEPLLTKERIRAIINDCFDPARYYFIDETQQKSYLETQTGWGADLTKEDKDKIIAIFQEEHCLVNIVDYFKE